MSRSHVKLCLIRNGHQVKENARCYCWQLNFVFVNNSNSLATREKNCSFIQSLHRNWFYAESVFPESPCDRFLLGTCIWRLMTSLMVECIANWRQISGGWVKKILLNNCIDNYLSVLDIFRFNLWHVLFLFYVLTIPSFCCNEALTVFLAILFM